MRPRPGTTSARRARPRSTRSGGTRCRAGGEIGLHPREEAGHRLAVAAGPQQQRAVDGVQRRAGIGMLRRDREERRTGGEHRHRLAQLPRKVPSPGTGGVDDLAARHGVPLSVRTGEAGRRPLRPLRPSCPRGSARPPVAPAAQPPARRLPDRRWRRASTTMRPSPPRDRTGQRRRAAGPSRSSTSRPAARASLRGPLQLRLVACAQIPDTRARRERRRSPRR